MRGRLRDQEKQRERAVEAGHRKATSRTFGTARAQGCGGVAHRRKTLFRQLRGHCHGSHRRRNQAHPGDLAGLDGKQHGGQSASGRFGRTGFGYRSTLAGGH